MGEGRIDYFAYDKRIITNGKDRCIYLIDINVINQHYRYIGYMYCPSLISDISDAPPKNIILPLIKILKFDNHISSDIMLHY